MERTIDVTTARRQFGTLLDEVFYKGDIITIERKGKPLARIVPVNNANNEGKNNSSLSDEQQQLFDELHSLPALSITENPTAVLRKNRNQKRQKAALQYGR